MGMFDWYEPAEEVLCPTCRSMISEWQGKSGPCALFVWRQGEAHPIDQPIDHDARIERERYREFALPETFDIWGACSKDHSWRCECRCTDGVWTEIGPLEPMPEPNWRW